MSYQVCVPESADYAKNLTHFTLIQGKQIFPCLYLQNGGGVWLYRVFDFEIP